MPEIHPLVLQLRFTRSEFKRALTGLTEGEASRRFLPMNCISWNVGHLAWQEQRYFLYFGQGLMPYPEVQ
jgi:DinB superfamily